MVVLQARYKNGIMKCIKLKYYEEQLYVNAMKIKKW